MSQCAVALRYLLERLEAHRGEWREVAYQTQLSYSWICKIIGGHISNPSVRHMIVLEDYFRAVDLDHPPEVSLQRVISWVEDELQLHRGTYPAIAYATGVSYATIQRLAARESTGSIGFKSLAMIEGYLVDYRAINPDFPSPKAALQDLA